MVLIRYLFSFLIEHAKGWDDGVWLSKRNFVYLGREAVLYTVSIVHAIISCCYFQCMYVTFGFDEAFGAYIRSLVGERFRCLGDNVPILYQEWDHREGSSTLSERNS